MLIVIDAGNTRTKWAGVQQDGELTAMQATVNTKLTTSILKQQLASASKVIIANVAGDAIASQLNDMMPEHLTPVFVKPQTEVCQVLNRYENTESLGIDRWAAVVAAWHMFKQPTTVINAGTAITIDALAKDKASKKGVYLGGSIMPGFQLMFESLSDGAVNLTADKAGRVCLFPKNTADAMQTGCMTAIVGAVMLQREQLEKRCAFLPKVVISGGDAVKIADALNPYLKRVVIAENLVLRGLALMGKE